ncbi:MAG: molybdopterin-dependent oxidoreductase [Pseudomonadota bacterium]|nr:molybdopterin-dependent oxidoreductase [Pseudomonadota bacterium]
MSSTWKTPSRRRLLKVLAATAVLLPQVSLSAVKRLLPANKAPRDFIEHNDLPLALETLRSVYGQGPITAISQFFVRNNVPMPESRIVADRDLWTVAIEGAGQTAGHTSSLSLAELKALPTTTIASVLQCSGNGRAFFDHSPSGSPWGVGAAGCALWTGVKLSTVFEHLGGANTEARFITATGGELLPDGIEPSSVAVERSVPIDKGLDDCLLVWEMNGEPLPLVHGGPVRLLVPGYFGVNNVKWVKRLAASVNESGNKIQQSGYRMRAVGESGNASHPSMYRMPVKSWLNGPGADRKTLPPGKHQLFGVAFSGERGIDHVDVSLDGGASWQRASLYGPDLGPNAWRTFSLEANLAEGDHLLVSKATDTAGESQPEHFPANHRGYGHNGWRDHGLAVEVSTQAMSEHRTAMSNTDTSIAAAAGVSRTEIDRASDKGGLGKRLFIETASPPCGVCHSLEAAGAKGVFGPDLDALKPDARRIRTAIAQGVGAMPAYAEQLTDPEVTALVDFITSSQ